MSPVRLFPRAVPAAAALFLLLGTAGCDLVRDFLEREDRTGALRAAAVAELTAPGGPLPTRIGVDSVLRIEPVSDSLFRLVVPHQAGADGEAAWELELSRVEVLPVFGGRAFADHVQERAVADDRRRALTRSGWSLLAEGGLEAVGRVRGEARAVGLPGRVPVDRIAYLAAASGQDEARWTLQPDTRTVLYLWAALEATYEDLMYADERVMNCAGTGDPMSAPRGVLLECTAEALAADFGDDAP